MGGVWRIARFVFIGKFHINADRVLTVTDPDVLERIWIELDSGQTIEAEARYLPEILGTGTRPHDGATLAGGVETAGGKESI